MKLACGLVLMLLLLLENVRGDSHLFREGTDACRNGDYPRAVQALADSARRRPASGTLQNLGIAQWQRGETGPAILAWEQALWLDPFNHAAHEDLRFARKTAQVETPELAWYEVVSTWLPVDWWAWIAGLSLWLAVGMAIVPGILRFPKQGWHQAAAAFGFAVFLLSLPAHWGVQTRSHIGFVLQKNTPLRLTPTQEAQFLTHLAAGDPVRVQANRGNYLLVATSRSRGWIERGQLGLISTPP